MNYEEKKQLSIQYSELNTLMIYFTGAFKEDSIDGLIYHYFQDATVADLKKTLIDLEDLINCNYTEEIIAEITLALGFNLGIDNDDWKPPTHSYKELLVYFKNELTKELEKRKESESK